MHRKRHIELSRPRRSLGHLEGSCPECENLTFKASQQLRLSIRVFYPPKSHATNACRNEALRASSRHPAAPTSANCDGKLSMILRACIARYFCIRPRTACQCPPTFHGNLLNVSASGMNCCNSADISGTCMTMVRATSARKCQ